MDRQMGRQTGIRTRLYEALVSKELSSPSSRFGIDTCGFDYVQQTARRLPCPRRTKSQEGVGRNGRSKGPSRYFRRRTTRSSPTSRVSGYSIPPPPDTAMMQDVTYSQALAWVINAMLMRMYFEFPTVAPSERVR
jgi:hypothetical protein